MDQLKKIRNELFVSDRIVTYKTAAAILQTNVNEAKCLLDQFVTDMKSKNESVCVTYVVGGITSDKKHKIVLVAGSKYEKVKSNFGSVTIDHIYSVQKSPHVEWIAIANVNDFMQDKKDNSPVADVKIKVEKDLPVTKTNNTTDKNPAKPAPKKGSLSNFFSQSTGTSEQNKLSNNSKESTVKKKQNSKTGKPNALASFITKNSNKENNSQVSNTTAAVVKTVESTAPDQQSDNEDEDFVVKNHKKRSRVLNDDDDGDDKPTNKLAKVDILDDNDDDKEEEIQLDDTSADIFGSPEEDEEMCDTEETVPSDSAEKDSQSSIVSTDNMYEDNDGYFVTERTPGSKKKINEVPKQLEETKKEIEKKEHVEKKVIKQKIKTNTNQKTLFNFFTKK